MRRVLILSTTLLLVSLLGSCGKNQCTHVVERTCSDVRAKAQQFGTNRTPTPEDLCPLIDWKGRERLKEACAGTEVRESISNLRPNTPLKVAEAMCDGMKLHILTPTVEELNECRQNEDDLEAAAIAAAEAKKQGKPIEQETPIEPLKPMSVPASTSVPTSVPTENTPSTPIPPAGTPPAAIPPTK
jgi:hypothetical protein